jgi:hypothetical protein
MKPEKIAASHKEKESREQTNKNEGRQNACPRVLP